MNKTEHAEKLLQLVEEGTSPFHVTAGAERQLLEAGFRKLEFGRDWNLENGGKYYFIHNGSSLAAFTLGEKICLRRFVPDSGCSHRFSGTSNQDKTGDKEKRGYRQLNAEVYGGAILNTWLDRPLSAAGRVALRSEDVFHPEIRYVDFKKPFLTIPNLAIHINREVNKGVELNKQKDMLPVVGLGEGKDDEAFFLDYLAGELRVEKEDILEYELGLYNTDTGDFLGMNDEFISSPRLDNLTSVQAVTTALLEGEREDGVNVAVFFDHEEIGSSTKQGAGSVFLSSVLERILLSFGRGREKFCSGLPTVNFSSVDGRLHPSFRTMQKRSDE